MSESIDRSNLATKDAIDGLITGQMNRQEFVKRATFLGLSASAIGSILAAAGKASAAGEVGYAWYVHVKRQRVGWRTLYMIPSRDGGSGIPSYRSDTPAPPALKHRSTWAAYIAAAPRPSTGGVGGNAMTGKTGAVS